MRYCIRKTKSGALMVYIVILVLMVINKPSRDTDQITDEHASNRYIEYVDFVNEFNGTKAEHTLDHNYSVYAVDESMETLIQFQEKVTEYRNATRLVYNRVPKCGSTAVHVTMGKLQATLNYTLHIASIFTEHHVTFKRQKHIIDTANSLPEPWIFDRHVFFINFTAHDQKMPVYINNIRDPIDRIVSWYYFIRFQPQHIRPMSDERKMRTYDDCVQNRFEECLATSNYTEYYNFMYIPFFCGSEDFCLQQTRRALHQAKLNVKKFYAAVGLMDDLPNFFAVLEYMLPQFFKGSLESFHANAKSLAQSFSTKKKVPPSTKTREIVQRLLPLEYDFYYFVKQRFYNILDNIKKLQLKEK